MDNEGEETYVEDQTAVRDTPTTTSQSIAFEKHATSYEASGDIIFPDDEDMSENCDLECINGECAFEYGDQFCKCNGGYRIGENLVECELYCSLACGNGDCVYNWIGDESCHCHSGYHFNQQSNTCDAIADNQPERNTGKQPTVATALTTGTKPLDGASRAKLTIAISDSSSLEMSGESESSYLFTQR